MRLQDSTTLTVRLKLAMIEDGIAEFGSGPHADPQFLEDIDAYRFRDACRAELARRERLRAEEAHAEF